MTFLCMFLHVQGGNHKKICFCYKTDTCWCCSSGLLEYPSTFLVCRDDPVSVCIGFSRYLGVLHGNVCCGLCGVVSKCPVEVLLRSVSTFGRGNISGGSMLFVVPIIHPCCWRVGFK